MIDADFYGPELAATHHDGFGDIAGDGAELTLTHLRHAGLEGGLVVDLGAGSGVLARRLVDAGHPVLGIDLSPHMVALAARTVPEATFRCGSIHDIELPEAAAVTATGEIVNYAVDQRAGWEALQALLTRVRAKLARGGVFLFDACGPGRAGPGGERTVRRQGAGWFVTATSTESADGSTLERAITLFTQEADGRYRRVDEHHTQVLFDPNRVMQLCRDHGFAVERREWYGSGATASTAPFGWTVFVASVPD